MKPFQFLGFLAVLLTLAGAAGCKSAATIAANAKFRAMNASAEQPSLTFLLTTRTVAADLAYPTASTYASEPPGGYTAHVEPSGTTTSFINQPVVFQSGISYTFIAAPAAFASPALTPIFLTDDNTAPATGQMRLRVVNASPDVGNLDVYVVSPGTDIQTANPTFTNLAFKSASGYQNLVAGNYDVFFTAPGQKTVLIDSGVLSLGKGQVRTLVALDNTGGFGTSLLADLN